MNKRTRINLLETMLRIREAELRLAAMFRDSMVIGALHLYVGEEAIAAGVCELLNDDDYITSTHRGHGHCVAKGLPLKGIFAEIAGKKTGCCGGKGGSMHMFYPQAGIMGTIGIVGGGIPIAVGTALSMQLQKTRQVAVSFFSDGAANNAAFHESLNMAGLWKLPVIFICENNRFATSVRVERSTAVEDISLRAAGYGMPGFSIDGNHVDKVHDTAATAVRRARAGKGPTLIECKTYRIRGHYEGDDTWDYRTREEVEKAHKRDPIDYWKNALLKEGVLSAKAFDEMCAEVDREVEEAVEFAVQSPYPDPDDLLVLAGPQHY